MIIASFGIGAIPVTNGYAFKIRDELKDQGRDVALANLGIPGANTDRINRAVSVFQRTGMTAELITVWGGVNDLIDGAEIDEFDDELDILLNRLHSGMEAFVVIANLPELTELPRFRSEPDADVTVQRVAEFNEVTTAAFVERGLPLIDLFKVLVCENRSNRAPEPQ